MPTYKNNTNRRITFQDKQRIHWQPGDVHSLHFFVPYKDLGLTLVDDKPYVLRNPTRGFGYTEFIVPVGGQVVYDIPYSETIELSVFAPKGLVLMYPGDCTEPFAVDEDVFHVSRYPWDMVAYLTFELDGDAEEDRPVYVKCEPFTERGK